MTGSQIRRRFLEHFASRDHVVLPSFPLVLPGDPTTLFTIAGMQPLKPYYQGLSSPPSPRLATCQKCFRAADLDQIGRTDRHSTFLEMLGNFAPGGDYFKETAIPLAWELVTGGLGMPGDRIRITVHPEDEQARRIWVEEVGVSPDRVHANGAAWWAAGATGPCGPCSELFFDRGPGHGCDLPDCYPEHCERYLEFWNLVFMQFDVQADGSLQPLPRPGIDTGMGLDRMAAILQGVESIFEADLLKPLADFVRDSSRRLMPASERKIADHLRAMTFLIGDGVVPTNEGRGYVLRRIIRRALLHARRLEMGVPLSEGVARVGAVMGDHYPEIVERRSLIQDVIGAETERFGRTLEQGMDHFERIARRQSEVILGEDAFRLHDTFGFPLELTEELAAERSLTVDQAGFMAAMAAQRERSRGLSRQRWLEGIPLPGAEFRGYAELELETEVILLRREGEEVDRVDEGDEVEVFLRATPFYGESGGQVGDTGSIEGGTGQVRVEDTQRPAEGVIAHLGIVTLGRLSPGDRVVARIAGARRRQIARHHTATHLLHKALRETFGDGAVQKGSWVGPDRATFDFALARAVTPDELERIGRRVAEQVRAALPFHERRTSYAEAVAGGAMHLFDEKYGDVVRVVCFGDWTCELCGGTHVGSSSDVGSAVLVSETSVGSGLRRIEMVVGEAADLLILARLRLLAELGRSLGVGPDQLSQRVIELRSQLRQRDRQIEQLRDELMRARTADGGQVDARVPLKLEQLPERMEGLDLKAYADRMLESINGHGVVAVVRGNRYVIKVSDDLTADLDATELREDFGPGGGTARLVNGRLDGQAEDAFSRLQARLQ